MSEGIVNGWLMIAQEIGSTTRWAREYHMSGKDPPLPVRYRGRRPFAYAKDLREWLANCPPRRR